MRLNMQPRFLGRQGERFFTQQFLSEGNPRAHIVFLPSFGEEMNRCRALVAEQARRFSADGYQSTLIDFFGTGDSEGDFTDASIEIWRENIDITIRTLLEEYDAPVILWGVRLGALIAMDYASNSKFAISNAILWQPVTSGKRFATQLLRQRVAALVNSGQSAETTAQIQDNLRSGGHVEVSGYLLADPLVKDIESLTLASVSPNLTGKTFWLENTDEAGGALGTASQKIVDQWKNDGCDVESHLFVGPPVWQLHKRDHAPELITMTSALLS